MLLGCIADDFTGATDLANTMVKSGLRTVQCIGVPAPDIDVGAVDAVVIALKSRTAPASEAVGASLAALAWLKKRGARQIVFKYCSTFDSTDTGNIGPVAEAIMDALGCDQTVFCPAFPAAGRTVYKSHLFVGDLLLSESGMQDHPLTPMTDPNLIRVLDRQTRGTVGGIDYAAVRCGAEAIRERLIALGGLGTRHVIVDALVDENLRALGHAVRDYPLITGGSGIALGLADNFRAQGHLSAPADPTLPTASGAAAILAGSCSSATRAQIAHAAARWPARALDVAAIAAGEDVVGPTLRWARKVGVGNPVVIYSSAEPDAVAAVQSAFGRDVVGGRIEATMGQIAVGLQRSGVRRLIVAGGETAGAVVGALGVSALRIGPEIDTGVPWTETLGGTPLALALKSGNFGSDDFFETALDMLP